jgi:peptidoglycan hydrolase-like protein with peptidoglycan-binding domain
MASKPLYSGPWYGPTNQSGKEPYKGKAAVALKRTVSRAGHLKWQGFDDTYNKNLERAVREIQKRHGLPVTGQVGLPTFKVLLKLKGGDGAPAIDAVAHRLFEEEWSRKHPPKPTRAQLEAKVRNAIVEYWETAIAHDSLWHYFQRRPFTTLGDDPAKGGYSDCSEMATAAMFYARQVTGIAVPDPNGYGYDGYGNTGTLYAHNRDRRVSGEYLEGDLALYGANASHHVTTCIKPGNAQTAVWGSNGSERGPLRCSLYYRGDLFAVVRPQLIP